MKNTNRMGNKSVTWAVRLAPWCLAGAVLLVGPSAQAQSCDPGDYLCADGSGCCASGTTCGTGSNGCDASMCCGDTGGGSSGGCDAGYMSCGDYCMPSGQVCCASVGRDDLSCPSGSSCNSDGSCTTSGGGGTTGTCDAGYTECGNYCMPSGQVCCASVGRDDLSCPSGSSCNSDGTCSDGSSGSSGGTIGGGSSGGTCPAGYSSCGTDHCSPAGDVCCASVGRPDMYCESGTTCNSDGTCADALTGTTTDGNTGSSTTGGGSYTQGEYTCFSADADAVGRCATLDTCCSTTDCYYDTDGLRFSCNGMDCNAAAQEMADYCTQSSSSSDSGDDGGCSVATAGAAAPSRSWLAWGALLALGAVLRRGRRKA